jgi:peptide/nickel transport system substrate-binding protein
MRQKRHLWVIALLSVVPLVAAACGGDDTPSSNGNGGNPSGEVTKGGTIIWESEEFGFTNGFDPTGEYLGEAWGVFTNLMTRSLMGYEHVAGDAGNQVIPDLAAEDPQISDDGLTYTFTLRDGVMFGPPLSRPVTARDVEFAFRRIATESLVAQYQNYYVGTIKGLELGKDPGEDGIEGIKVIDDKTIEFTLTKPTGDFLYRLAMPAASPMPEEVAGCFDKAGDYGRYVISSSSYMFEGSEDLDASSCKTLKPISGYDPTKAMILVRNPDYDQSTDDVRHQHEHERPRAEGALGRDRVRSDANSADPAEVRPGPGAQGPPARGGRRPNLVHHAEPQRSADGRHPRS